MRSLSLALLVTLLAASLSPCLAQEPTSTSTLSKKQHRALCKAKANQPLEPSDVEPLEIGPENRPTPVHTPGPQFPPHLNPSTVVIEAIIDEDGCVREARVSKTAQKAIDAAALAAVRTWVFKPAELNGKPVRVRYWVSITYHGFQ